MSDGRDELVQRGLAGPAVAALTARALGELPFEALGPTKALLKRFFSAGEWGPDDEAALAGSVGPGEGWWREPLDEEVTLAFGWVEGRFRLAATVADQGGPATAAPVPDLAATFEGPVVPEATPNPRTLVFRTGPIHDGESQEYRAGDEVSDARVDRLVRSFPDVATVLVARDFVAVSVRRPGQWEALLVPVLALVTEEFAAAEAGEARAQVPGATVDVRGVAAGPAHRDRGRQPSALDRAWSELGRLRPDQPDELTTILAAAAGPEAAHRQVAAGLLAEAPAGEAHPAWARLVADPSRVVRRAAVDAVVGARRPELRPLLEGALADTDAWVRWKALRGLAELGAGSSGPAIEPLLADPDFRVRLEAQAALRA